MLPAIHRLTSPAEFREVVRRGSRSGGPLLVVHLLASRAQTPTRAGFVVSKAVGGAVVRNRVKRRLRHLVRDRLEQVPPGSKLVLRAQPAAANAPYADLAVELDRRLERARGHRVSP